MAHTLKKNLRHLTPGEALWLLRRRAGSSQSDMASALSISPRAYWAAERDIALYKPPGKRPVATLPERLSLARRRHGLTLRATAALLGTSHPTLLRAESAGEAGLVAKWEGLGYRF